MINRKTQSLVSLLLLPVLICASSIAALGGQEDSRISRLAQATDRSGPTSAEASLLKVRMLIASKEWVRAESLLSQIVAEQPASENFDAALYWLAFSQKKQGKLQQAERALDQLITKYPESTWVTDAREMRVEIAPLIGNMMLIATETTSPEDEIKIAALQSLFMADPARAVTIAADMLKDGSSASPLLKQTALRLLGQFGGKQSTATLIEIARRHMDVSMRQKAISSLVWKADEEVFNLLRELATDPVNEIAEAAVYALAGAPSAARREKTFEVMAQAARSAKAIGARRQALSWLALNGGDTGLDELMKVYRSTDDVEIKKTVIAALGSPYGVYLMPSSSASLLTTYTSPVAVQVYSEMVTATAEARLADRAEVKNSQAAKRARAASLLREIYDVERGAELKGQIITALGHHQTNKEALSKLMEIAKNDPLPEMRKMAIARLGQSKDPDALRLLEELLK